MSEDDLSYKLKKNWYIILGVIVWYWLRQDAKPITLNNSVDYYFSCIVFVVILCKWLLEEGKYKTGMLISEGVHGSVSGEPREVGIWYIFRLGGIKWGGIFFRGDEETVIVPKSACQKHFDNWECNIRVEQIPYDNAPHEVYDIMEYESFPTHHVWLGYSGLDKETSDPEYLKKTEYSKQQDMVINNLKNALKGKIVITEEQQKHIERMAGKKRGLFGGVKKQQNEEQQQ